MKNLIETQVSENKSNWTNILKGIGISYIITFVLLFIFSVILTYTSIGENTIAPVIIILTIVSILIGSSIGSSKIKKNGIINGGIIGFVYIFMLYFLSSIIQVGFSFNIYAIAMIILSILAGMIGGIVGVNLRK